MSELPNVVLDHLVDIEGWTHTDYIGQLMMTIMLRIATMIMMMMMKVEIIVMYDIFSCDGRRRVGLQIHPRLAAPVLSTISDYKIVSEYKIY